MIVLSSSKDVWSRNFCITKTKEVIVMGVNSPQIYFKAMVRRNVAVLLPSPSPAELHKSDTVVVVVVLYNMGKGVKWAGLNPSKVTFWPCVMGCKNGREDEG